VGGGATCEAVATQLGIGASTVNNCVKEVSLKICSTFQDKIKFPSEEQEIAQVMHGLRYCVGEIDGTHVKWLMCPETQFYE